MLKVTGEVGSERTFHFEDFQSISAEFQIVDFSTIVPGRSGTAVRLEGILQAVGATASARFLGLHGSHDDFHASVPLAEVRERGYLIYGVDGHALPQDKGGPVRFFIPDHAQCNTDEIDECANVKFVDHMELTASKGFDNRPTDEEEHAKLHEGDHS